MNLGLKQQVYGRRWWREKNITNQMKYNLNDHFKKFKNYKRPI